MPRNQRIHSSSTWVDTRVNLDMLTGTTQQLSLLGAMTEPDARVATLTRTIVRLFFTMESPNVTAGVTGLWYGIGLIGRVAFDLGVTGTPDPQTPLDKPTLGWVIRDVHMSHNSGATNSRYSVNQVPSQHHDLLAQWKIQNGVLSLKIANEVFSGSGYSIRVSGLIRCFYLI